MPRASPTTTTELNQYLAERWPNAALISLNLRYAPRADRTRPSASGMTQAGNRVVTSARVTALRENASGWVAETTAGGFEGTFIVNCAGLHSDRVSELAGERRDVRIVPFRGEYYQLRKERESLVRHALTHACTAVATLNDREFLETVRQIGQSDPDQE